MRPDDSDELLMGRIAAGDRQAFHRLAERYARRAHAVAQRLLFNRTEAEDVVQDVFIKLWVHAPDWDEAKAKFSTWFYRVLTNACIDVQRKRKKMVGLDDAMEIVDTAIGTEQRLVNAQTEKQVKQAIALLPDRQQVALTLSYYEGFSNQQAADIMGVHVKALEALLVRARKTLRRTLAGLIEERHG